MPTQGKIIAVRRQRGAVARHLIGPEDKLTDFVNRASADNQDFSRWLEKNGLAKISKDDRAALLGMAEDLAATRDALEKTDRTSWQHIWRNDLQKSVRHVTKTRPAPVARKTRTERAPMSMPRKWKRSERK